MKHAITLLLSCLFLSGCATNGNMKTGSADQEPVMPAKIAGMNIPGDDIGRIRYGEDVKAYTIGRYVDPSDPSIMYEKNILYRTEESPRWNLRPNTEFSPPFSGSPGDNPDRQGLLPRELESEIGRQGKISENMVSVAGNAIRAMEQIRLQNMEIMRKLAEHEKMINEMRNP